MENRHLVIDGLPHGGYVVSDLGVAGRISIMLFASLNIDEALLFIKEHIEKNSDVPATG